MVSKIAIIESITSSSLSQHFQINLFLENLECEERKMFIEELDMNQFIIG